MIVKLPASRTQNTQWDPVSYLKFARLRERPVVELLDHIHLEHPECIYDLGCGTGIATRLLSQRWPDAELTGVDSSAQMLCEASYLPIQALWKRCDVQDWQSERPADLLMAAAVLYFISDHEHLLPQLLSQLNSGGCLAAHMPNWRDARWYQLMLETLKHGGVGGASLGSTELYRSMAVRTVMTQDNYYRLLAPLTQELDIWETENLQVVDGLSPVFDWVKVSALRPVLLALNDDERERFLEQYIPRVHQYYPPEADGHTLFPFKRMFIVAKV